MKVITVASYPRTGSSLLIRRMERRGVTALLEIFHANPVIAKRHLSLDRRLRSCPELLRDYTRETYTQEPIALIDAITRLKPNSEALAFKVFPGHLPAEALEKVIARSDALVVHSRNRLHSFLSDVIATRLGSWGGTTTREQHVDFSAVAFKCYSEHIQKFLAQAMKLAVDQNTNILFSSYEKLITPPGCDSVVEAMLSTLLGHKAHPPNPSARLPTRQDDRSLASEKVTNPGELIEFLQQHDALALNAGTFDMAFSRYTSFGHIS